MKVIPILYAHFFSQRNVLFSAQIIQITKLEKKPSLIGEVLMRLELQRISVKYQAMLI